MQVSIHSDRLPQVMVTLVWMINPTQRGFPTQNQGIHWVNRLNTKPTGLCTVMTTLHAPSIPPWGIYQLSLTRKDRDPSLLLFKLFCLYPALAILFLPFSFLFLSHTLYNTGITPEHQSSDAKPQHAMTTHNPTTTVQIGEQNNVWNDFAWNMNEISCTIFNLC